MHIDSSGQILFNQAQLTCFRVSGDEDVIWSCLEVFNIFPVVNEEWNHSDAFKITYLWPR